MRAVVRTVTADDTRSVGERLAGLLDGGDVVVLTGELGAGKTTLVQGVGAGLGITERVASPTFTLVREYSGRLPVIHADVFRLERVGEVIQLGLDEAGRDAVLMVEWGDAIEDELPPERLRIELTSEDPDGETEVRRISLTGLGSSWQERWPRLAAAVEPWTVPG
jgi:tRNA threonylcarbamoyladenosine biosynthesis protein TsaE